MEEKIIYSKFSSERNQEYAIRTDIVYLEGEKYVKKSPLYHAGREHIKVMQENYVILASMYGNSNIAKCKLNNKNELYMEYISGKTLSAMLEECINNGQMKSFYDLLDKYVDFVKKTSHEQEALSNAGSEDFRSPKRISNIDLLFDNIIVRNGKFVIIDYEWLVPAIGYKNILYRAVELFFVRSQLDDFENIKNGIFKKYGISLADKNYEDMDKVLFSRVFNNASCRYQKQIISTFINHSMYDTVTIFAYQEDGYTCDNAIFLQAKKISEDEIYVHIDLPKQGIKSRFRFDPLEGSYCKFELLGIETDTDEYSFMAYNANFSQNNKYLFLTVDPIMEFVGSFEKATYFNIRYKLTVMDFDKAVRELQNTLEYAAKCAEYADGLLKKIQAIEQSRGYRALEKFRAIKSKVITQT